MTMAGFMISVEHRNIQNKLSGFKLRLFVAIKLQSALFLIASHSPTSGRQCEMNLITALGVSNGMNCVCCIEEIHPVQYFATRFARLILPFRTLFPQSKSRDEDALPAV